MLDTVVRGNADKVEAIRRAQADGRVSERFSPAVLLTLVLHLSSVWAVQIPEADVLTRELSVDERRRVIEDAVQALVS
jgi:hypothetical protein